MAEYNPDEFFEAERYPLPIICGECGHTMRPVHKHCVPDMPRTYFCTFCGAGFHENNPGIRFREKQTNFDRIRSLTVEEMAEYLTEKFLYSAPQKMREDKDVVQEVYDTTLDWLQQEVEE